MQGMYTRKREGSRSVTDDGKHASGVAAQSFVGSPGRLKAVSPIKVVYHVPLAS